MAWHDLALNSECIDCLQSHSREQNTPFQSPCLVKYILKPRKKILGEGQNDGVHQTVAFDGNR